MAVRLHHVVVDAHDLPGLARFWAQALGWRVLSERGREVVIGPDESAPIGMCFMPVPETKTIKNRVHLDLTTGADDRDAEIERLLRLGARRVNIGQTGDESWTVLADPEGNEFCVVRPNQPSSNDRPANTPTDVALLRERERTRWSREIAGIARLFRQTSSPRCLGCSRPDLTPDRALPSFDARPHAQRRPCQSARRSGITYKQNSLRRATTLCANNALA